MAEHDLANNFASALTKLSGELTSSKIMSLTFLYPKINNNETDKIKKDDDPAQCFLRKLLEDPEELHSTNVDGLIRKLEEIKLKKAAGILKLYKSRNANLINKEIERQEQEEQTVASSASSSTAKSPPSQKGDRTEGQTVASSASSSTAKSPPSQKGDDTEEQTVASSASSSTAKSPPSQKGDHTEGQTVASSASSSTVKSPPSQKGDDTEKQLVASSASSSPVKSPPSQKGDHTDFLFVSFSSKNREEVTKLVSKIESVFGVDSCWMYTRRNLPGDYTLDSITAAIKKADIMLCMITKDYIDSEICRDEFNLAKAHKKLIIPLHLEKVKVPYQTRNGGDPGIQLEATKLVYARMYIDNPEPEFQNVIDKIKECLFGRDANDSGETLVAPGSPSTSGSQKRKSSQDGDDSEVKVTRKE